MTKCNPWLEIPAPEFEGGACVGKPPELWDAVESRTRRLPTRVEAAIAICAGCPVRQECLAYAISNPVSGVWGGRLFVGLREYRPTLRVAIS